MRGQNKSHKRVNLDTAASMELEMPLSFMAKQKRVKKTPGSGEALLRGQVKTLLQKVEEEAVISKLTLEVVDEIFEKNKEVECEKSVITRSLLLDFSDKSEVSECSSEVTYQEVTHGSGGSAEDDGASVWSMQVNASTHDEDEDEMEEEMGEEEEEGDYNEDEECYEGEDDGGLLVDELCAGLNNISVDEKGCGEHTRFVYNSDDEIVEKVVEYCDKDSSNVM